MIKSKLIQGSLTEAQSGLDTLLREIERNEETTNVKFELSTCWDGTEAPTVKAVCVTILVIWEEIEVD